MSDYRRISSPLLNDFSRDSLRSLMQQLSPYTTGAISQLGQQAINPNADEYRQASIDQFQQDDLPRILQQYGGFGSGKNSGLNNALALGAQNLGQNIASRREGMQNDAIRQLLGLQTQLINTRTDEYGFMPKKENYMTKIMTDLLPKIAAAAAMAMI